MLKNQPTKAPTRKMWAVILAAVIVNGLIGVIEYLYPGTTDALPAEAWITSLAMIFAGYMTRERVSE